MHDTHTLGGLSDDELLRRLLDLLRHSRRVEADLVAHIGEVDSRRLYLREATPSMFAYCTEVLHLSEAEAYLRIAVARASRDHPVLLAMLADGRLHLSGVAKLAPHLTGDNRDAILKRAAHRSKRRIEELIAEIVPRPDVRSAMRRLPDRSRGPHVVSPVSDEAVRDGLAATALIVAGGRGGEELHACLPTAANTGATPGAVPGVAAAADFSSVELRPDGVAQVARSVDPAPATPVRAGALSRSALPATDGDRIRPGASIEALAPSRYRVQFTASGELRDELERLRALLLSSIPDGDLGAVIAHAVSETLERLEARRFAKRRAQRSMTVSPAPGPIRGIPAVSRHVPASIRRAVFERDRGQCAYVDRAGRRCSARGRLEYHHRHPYGMGGEHSLGNVCLLCRTHNVHLAEHDYGSEKMAGCRPTASRYR